MTTLQARPDIPSAAKTPERAFPRSGVSYWLTGALAVASAASAAGTFFVPGVLTGPAAMNGSARGTALVVLVAAVPVLLAAMRAAARGSARAVIAWLGAAGYLLYNAIMFVFATPFNRLFLIYIAMLSLSIWTVIAVLAQLDRPVLQRHFRPTMPVRAIAVYVWVVVVLNLVAWLSAIVPALFAKTPADLLYGTGLTTNPVYVQDLAFWLLLMAVAGVWLWRRQTWGYIVAGAVLTLWVLESISVAVDQWFGHNADPTSALVSGTMVWVFAGLAVVGCVPLAFFFRSVTDDA